MTTRVTALLLEVLQDEFEVHELTLTNELELSASITATRARVADFTNALTLVASISAVPLTQSLFSELGLSASIVVQGSYSRTLSSGLSLAATVTREGNTPELVLENDLGLAVFIHTRSFTVDLATALTLEQEITAGLPVSVELSNVMDLLSSIRESSVYVSLDNSLGLSVEFIADTTSISRTLTSTLELAASISKSATTDYYRTFPDPAAPEHGLFLAVSILAHSNSIPESLLSTLELEADTQISREGKTPAAAELELEAEMVMVVERAARQLTNTLDLQVGFNVQLDRSGCDLKTYNPIVGSSSPVETTSSRTAELENDVVFTYPPSTETTSLTLGRPIYGDTQTIAISRLNATLRGNELVIASNDPAPSQETLEFTFQSICDDQREAIMDFLELTSGRQIRLRDHFGQRWLGVILTPDADLIYVRRNSSRLTLVFQGVRE